MGRTTKPQKLIIFSLIICFMTAILVCSLFSFQGKKGAGYFGVYTFQREIVRADGSRVEFYESGDKYFSYCHDKDGFILIREGDELYYAYNDNGRPVASDVRYGQKGLAALTAPRMLASEIDFDSNPDLLTDYPVDEEFAPRPLNGSGEPRVIANIIIYIVFKDESTAPLEANPARPYLEDNDPSLADYFYKASDGGIEVVNFYPQNGSNVYVYKAPYNREYYNVKQSQTTTRGERESQLLTAAVNAAAGRFNFGGVDIDTNDDGYVDSVTFLISGASSTDWGGLLWPHSWNLASINKTYNKSNEARIGDILVGNYSFNFVSSIDVGVLSHEFFHVLGAPDLYHYDYDFVPVGDWDIMQFNKPTPQLPLTYMRTQYLGVSQSRVGTVTGNGVYSLTPTVTASPAARLAYKIPSNVSGQYFMVEYRSNSAYPTYDSELPDSGLIVYRIKEGVQDGNKNARHQNPSYPDEVYVFRPKLPDNDYRVAGKNLYDRSKVEIAYAAMSPNNSLFSSVGATLEAKPNSRYDYGTLFYVDGKNSGISIETLSVTDSRIEFRVSLNSANTIPDNYFDDKINLTSAELVNGDFAGVNVAFTVGEIQLTYLKNIAVKLKSAGGSVLAENNLNLSRFRTDYENGERIFDSKFVVNDKGFPVGGIFDAGDFLLDDEPVMAEMWVTDGDNDTKLLKTIFISKPVGWDTVLATRAELKASISASTRITLGVRKDGTVQRSGAGVYTDGQWAVDVYTNIISASAGYSHTLLLTTQLRVISLGENDFGEGSVSHWSDIKQIEAGYRTSYAINLEGRVYAVGDNSYGQLNVLDWRNIVSISAGVRHVAAVDSMGKAFAAGANTEGQTSVSHITEAKAVACGATFSAFLLKDGRVAVVGSLAGKEETESWTRIVKIAAGENFILGLREDKTVVAAGVNDFGQCGVSHLEDIIDIAGGETHAAFLREDGVVLFTGVSKDGYNTTSGIGNLIYDDYIGATGIDFNVGRTTLYLGLPERAISFSQAAVLPASATYKKINYSSSDPSVAYVTSNGTINATGVGTAVITARVSGTEIYKEITVTVKPYIRPVSMSFADSEISVIAGGSASLMLNFGPEGATVYGNITYEIIQNPGLAVIDQNGIITAGSTFGEVHVIAILTQGDLALQTVTPCIVRIVSNVQSIEVITPPNKTEYLYGEDFDVTGGKIRITYMDGSTAEQSITPIMIYGYDKYALGDQPVRIKYGHHETQINVTVNNYVKEARLYSAGKTEYIYGEPLDLSGVTVTLIKANGDESRVTLSSDTISYQGYDENKVGVQTVRLTFTLDGKTFNAEYAVTVLDVVSYISTAAITRDTYLFGEELSGAEAIILVMVSGAQKSVRLDDENITVSDYDPYICGEQHATIEYSDPVSGRTHSVFKTFTVEINGRFIVYSIDDLGERHYPPEYPESPEPVYFTVGGDLPIGVTLRLADERLIDIGRDASAKIYFRVSSFNNLSEGDGFATIVITYHRMVSGTPAPEEHPIEITVFGEAEIVSYTIDGQTQYPYGTRPEFYVYTVDKNGNHGGGIADKLAYNPELTDEPQTCYIYYHNRVYTEQIVIYDYIAEIEPVADITTLYGTPVEIRVYAYKAKAGRVALSPEDYQITGLDFYALGSHTVTVSAGDKSTTFTLQVNDAVASIQVKQGIAETCLYGQEPSFYSVYTVTMLSGARSEIEFNTNDFTVSNFNAYLLTPQIVSITHKQTGEVFRFTVTAKDYIQRIAPASGAVLSYEYGEALSFDVSVFMAAGSQRTVHITDCTVSGYDPHVLGDQTITISYQGVSETAIVTVQDTVKGLQLDMPPAINLKYGEALSFLGATLKIYYASGGEPRTYKNREIEGIPCSYNPLQTGKQTVTLTVGNQTAYFTVTVAAKKADTYRLKENAVFTQKEKSIVFDRTATAEELKESLVYADYLTAKIKKADGSVVPLEQVGILRSDYTLQIVNASDFTVFSYKLYLKGDANCDGVLDENDITSLADKLLKGNYDRDMVDYDGDGAFTLTDLVNWARKTLPPVNPLNAMANAFVSDAKPNKKEEGNE